MCRRIIAILFVLITIIGCISASAWGSPEILGFLKDEQRDQCDDYYIMLLAKKYGFTILPDMLQCDYGENTFEELNFQNILDPIDEMALDEIDMNVNLYRNIARQEIEDLYSADYIQALIDGPFNTVIGPGGVFRGGGAGRIVVTDEDKRYYVVEPNLTDIQKQKIFTDFKALSMNNPLNYIERDVLISALNWSYTFSAWQVWNKSFSFYNSTGGIVCKITVTSNGSSSATEKLEYWYGGNWTVQTGGISYANNRNYSVSNGNLRLNGSPIYGCVGIVNYANKENSIKTYFESSLNTSSNYDDSDNWDGSISLSMYSDGDIVRTDSMFYELFHDDPSFQLDNGGKLQYSEDLYNGNNVLSENPIFGINLDKEYGSLGLITRTPGEIVDSGKVTGTSIYYTPSPSPTVSVTPSVSPEPTPSSEPTQEYITPEILNGVQTGIESFFDKIGELVGSALTGITNIFGNVSKVVLDIQKYVGTGFGGQLQIFFSSLPVELITMFASGFTILIIYVIIKTFMR